jgi:hypothetical protein
MLLATASPYKRSQRRVSGSLALSHVKNLSVQLETAIKPKQSAHAIIESIVDKFNSARKKTQKND